jgi:hypothetical protein
MMPCKSFYLALMIVIYVYIITQDDDSDLQNRLESSGNRWSMEALFRPETVRFFSGRFLPTSCAFGQENVSVGSVGRMVWM